MSKVEEYVAFIETLHLFQGIGEGHLFNFAESFHAKTFSAGKTIIRAGEKASHFYIIFSGEVDLTISGKIEKTETYVRGDYLGANAIISEKISSSAVAKTNVILLALDLSSNQLSGSIDLLKNNLEVSVKCRELVAEKDFGWLNEDEVVYFLKRKHISLFWRRMFVPILFIAFGVLAMGIWWIKFSNVFWTIGVFLLGSAVILPLWYWLDWRNDYYVVTNQRLIWEEKIIGVYSSRQEAILADILSVSINTDKLIQSFLDYGRISAHIMVGGIDLDYTPHPRHAKRLLDELIERTKSQYQQKTEEEIRQAIIKKLQNPNPPAVHKRTPVPKKKPFSEKLRAKLLPKKQYHIFKQRFEDGGDIIYRKHWIVLLRLVGIPLLISALLLYFVSTQTYFILVQSPEALSDSLVSLAAVAAVASIGWGIFQYFSWSYDIFKVTKSAIFDIDRKPLGNENSRSAPLDNIESLTYKRDGLMNIFFNYGTVYIHIGSEAFDFQDVLDPASVQRDISRRYTANHISKKENAAKKDNQKWIDWFLTYHQSEEEFQKLIKKLQKEKEERELAEAIAAEENDEREDYE